MKGKRSLQFDRIRKFLSIRKSLRAKLALGVTLPLLIILISISVIHYWRERQLLENQIQLTVQQLGEVALGSLRHAMLLNDREMLSNVIADVGAMDNIQRIQIIDLQGQVKVSNQNISIGLAQNLEEAGCSECHRFPPETRPFTTHLSTDDDTLRISSPIKNEPECNVCHAEQTAHLGVLLVDISLINIEKRLLNDLRLDLVFSIISTTLVTLGLSFLIHWLIVRRVETLHRPLSEFAHGGFSTRLPTPKEPADELDELSIAFNNMADELEHQIRAREERSQLRTQAIIEERERIARELHDGLAQLLGYVNTKAMAVRLLISDGQMKAADDQLQQIEKTTQELYVETREAILGLKMAGKSDVGLAATIRDFTTQFSKLSSLPVELKISPAAEQISLPVEIDLQLLRIVQESLTNIRKHASAHQAWVSLDLSNSILRLEIMDNGAGFDDRHDHSDGQPQFGLSIMRERADTIGAEFDLETNRGQGTRIKVSLQIKDYGADARSRS